MEIKIITEQNCNDINIPNEPFTQWGKMVPSYVNEKWNYTTVKFKDDDISEMRFPDENYNFNEMKKDCIFVGAYENGVCIGLAVLQNAMFNYMYLYDLKVKREFRGRGVASMLITKAREIAKQQDCGGIYTLCQDNNLSACLFYIKAGFYIGGLDTNVYKGTSQQDKSDIVFYLDI